jgi:DMSO/TMAO reductase YedYZ molybdopterin-dependent catalytic subunit
VIPWLDQPAPNPIPANVGNLLKWEALESWRTPADNFFFVNHYGQPDPLDDESTWRVDIGGLVAHPRALTLADLKARERREVDFTLECSGNTGTGLDFFIGGIGNARGGCAVGPAASGGGCPGPGHRSGFLGKR